MRLNLETKPRDRSYFTTSLLEAEVHEDNASANTLYTRFFIPRTPRLARGVEPCARTHCALAVETRRARKSAHSVHREKTTTELAHSAYSILTHVEQAEFVRDGCVARVAIAAEGGMGHVEVKQKV